MRMQQSITPSNQALLPQRSSHFGLVGGVLLCVAIAVLAEWTAPHVPLLQAPLLAIAIGVVLANTVQEPLWLKKLCVSDVSAFALKCGIVLLGASLNLGDILRTGLHSLPLLMATIAAGLMGSFGIGRAMSVDWRVRFLIGIGTTICGASAITALAPVLRAKPEEIAYSISVIFFFNVLAVFAFPPLGHLLGLSDTGFGLWAGTAVNDTSAVVAAGFAYSHNAGVTATIVKLTRTTLIIPLVIGFGLAMPLFDSELKHSETSLVKRVYLAVPIFIVLFVAAAILNSLQLMGSYAPDIQLLGRWILLIALAGVGLQGTWSAFADAGTKPLMLGLVTWIAVGLSSLLIQTWTHAL